MVWHGLAFVILAWAQAIWFSASPSFAAADQVDEADDDIRQQLTERIDKRRRVQPTTIDIRGWPLTLSGSYEIKLDNLRPANSRAELGRRDRLLLDHGVEGEAFYRLNSQLSLFAQLHLT